MLTVNDLKTWLHRNELGHADKLLLTLSTFEAPAKVKELRTRAREAGLKITDAWNPSTSLARSKGLAIHNGAGWQLTDAGREYLHALGVPPANAAATKLAADLRVELAKITDNDTRAFVEEAIRCYEAHLLRSAVVMSWLASVDVLQKHVVNTCLPAFNAEASKADSNWKPAKTADDIGRMKETIFLDRLAAISVIGKNVKDELKACLGLRNGCGHPNSLKLGPNAVAHHLETLLLNVFQKF